jgi:hypothetical protein
VVIVTLYENLSYLQGRKTQKLVNGALVDATLLNEPAVEAEGVTGRRVAWAHPFTPDEEQWIRDYVASLNKPIRDRIQFLDVLPSGWRAPIGNTE